MSFHERFKGRTSLIDKEGITGVVKSQAQPILKAESPLSGVRKKNNMLEHSNSVDERQYKIKQKMFKITDGIIEKFEDEDRDFRKNLKIEVPISPKKLYSYDSPLLEKMKEEEDLKAFHSAKKKSNMSYNMNELSPTIKAAKNEIYGQDLYSSNILDNLNLSQQKTNTSSFIRSNRSLLTEPPKNINITTQSNPTLSPKNFINNRSEFFSKQILSPSLRENNNNLKKTNHLNHGITKKESVFDNFEYNSILPSINQKANLSNSGRNIVLHNSYLFNENSNKNINVSPNSIFNQFGNFDYASQNNYNSSNKEKEKLDYELSRLEDQYHDILSKFSILSKKRELLN